MFVEQWYNGTSLIAYDIQNVCVCLSVYLNYFPLGCHFFSLSVSCNVYIQTHTHTHTVSLSAALTIPIILINGTQNLQFIFILDHKNHFVSSKCRNDNSTHTHTHIHIHIDMQTYSLCSNEIVDFRTKCL